LTASAAVISTRFCNDRAGSIPVLFAVSALLRLTNNQGAVVSKIDNLNFWQSGDAFSAIAMQATRGSQRLIQ
jgi:hypothetical protein